MGKDGAILDSIPGSAADRAGVIPGAKPLAVNGRRGTPNSLKSAIQQAQQKTVPIRLPFENGDVFETCVVEYHGGARYPRLQRDSGRPILLADILAPKV